MPPLCQVSVLPRRDCDFVRVMAGELFCVSVAVLIVLRGERFSVFGLGVVVPVVCLLFVEEEEVDDLRSSERFAVRK